MKRLAALRQGVLTRAMKAASARRVEVEVSGLTLVIDPGVCNPAPALGVSLAPLYEAALMGVAPGERVLDVGTGCGVWALLAARAGADVTATDLPHVTFAALEASAQKNGLAIPRCLHGDLFAPVVGERFDRVLFNPPFHFGAPRDDAERAYLGGPSGEVLRSFLAALPDHLTARGRAFVILPREEQRGYADALAVYSVDVLAHRWMPVLGRVELLGLAPRSAR